MQKSYTPAVLAVLLLAGTAGCQHDGKASPAVPVPSVSAPSLSAPAPVATATTAASPAPVDRAFPLTVSRRGGFAGVDDRASITADGTAVVTRRGRPEVRISVPPATMDELRRLLTGPDLAGQSAPPEPACNDGYEYELASPASTVLVHDCGARSGAALDRLLTVAAELFAG